MQQLEVRSLKGSFVVQKQAGWKQWQQHAKISLIT